MHARNLNHASVFEIGIAIREFEMNGIIYLVGLVVIVLAILSLFGLR